MTRRSPKVGQRAATDAPVFGTVLLALVVAASALGCPASVRPSRLASARPRPTLSAAPSPAVPQPAARWDEPAGAAVPTVDELPALIAETGSAPLGTRAPSVVAAAAPDGRWLVVCEARRDTDGDGRVQVGLGFHGDTYGDALEPFFVSRGGPGEAIDDFVAADPSGRWVVLVRQRRLLLRDTAIGRDEDLSVRGADASTDDAPLFGHRAAGFDEAGRRVFFVRTEGARTFVTVRELATGAEASIPVDGVLDRAGLLGDGAWLALRVVERDTDGDGRLAPPTQQTSLGARRCRGPVMSFSTGGAIGDETVLRVARLGRDRAVRALPGVPVVALGARLLVRTPSRALVAVSEDGTTREWAPASCRGVVLAVAPTFDRALVGCVGADEMHAPLELAGDGGRRPLGVEGTAFLQQEAPPVVAVATIGQLRQEPSMVPYPTVDLRTGVVTSPPATDTLEDYELFTSAGVQVRSRPGRLVLRDLASGAERELVRIPDHGYGCLTSGRFAICNGALIDLRRGRAVARVIEAPVVFAPDGRLLVREPGQADPFGLPPGPFRWMRAAAPVGAP